MKPLAFFLFLFFTGTVVYGSDSLQVSLSKKNFNKGDTIDFKCTVPDFAALKLNAATLNVWIENVENHSRWKYRYPMINGEVSASLTISDKIPDGRYAINFLVQRGFFKITGTLLDHEKKDTSIIYMMIPKSKTGSYFDNTHIAPDGSFRLKSTLFADSAYFIFSPAKKVKNNPLSIKIETLLDSSFTPVFQETHFITVGDPKMMVSKQIDTSGYTFNVQDVTATLPNVTVTGKFKTKVQQYNEENSSGLFQKDDAMIFDGLGSDEIAHSITLLQFLQARVAGLTVQKNDAGQDIAKWRSETVEVYIDEFRVDAADYTLISLSDIAMIKVYRPPAMLSSFGGGAGAIAIYTKKGAYATDNRTRHNFIVKGYTKIESVWE